MIDSAVRVSATDHAVHRYRRRHRAPRATLEEVAAVMRAGDYRVAPPHGIMENLAGREQEPDGYVVNGAVVFPVVLDGDTLVALTCLKAHRRAKADRRAWREEQRELAA